MQIVKVRPARVTDALAWAELRRALWSESSEAEHRREIDQYFRGEFPRSPWVALLAEGEDERLLGFAEVSVRPHAEGCDGTRVAYLEGWYVVPDARQRGAGRALVEAAEDWGREQRCVEFASDAHPDNRVSRDAHLAVGFADAGLVQCFAKKL